ncbi:MAG: class I SAM-dependent methyltransferase family protein [Candidatus Omnitrophica bacterium]|nr:class I SAM-dependent methyltransferase family protein [Candidatus Omnitrophota bacterium]
MKEKWKKWFAGSLIKTNKEFSEFQKLLPEFNFLNYSEPEIRKKNIELIKHKSSLIREVILNKGGWLLPEKAYRKDPTHLTMADMHDREFDDFVLNHNFTTSLFTRFKFIVNDLLPRYINKFTQNGKKVKIASFGSGSGFDVMEAIKKFNGFCSADLYEIDPVAIEAGKRCAKENNLIEKIKFIRNDFTKIKNYKFDIGLLIGIICPLSDSLAKKTMHDIYKGMPVGSVLIVSSSSDRMPDDTLGRFIIEYCGDWYLQFRDSIRMEKLAKQSDFKVLEILEEPMKYHKLMVCVKQD